MTRSPPNPPKPGSKSATSDRDDTEPSLPPVEATKGAGRPLPKLARATDHPRTRIEPRARATMPNPAPRGSPGMSRIAARMTPPSPAPPQRVSNLPFAREEIVRPIDERNYTPAKLPRFTGDLAGAPPQGAAPAAAAPAPAPAPAPQATTPPPTTSHATMPPTAQASPTVPPQLHTESAPHPLPPPRLLVQSLAQSGLPSMLALPSLGRGDTARLPEVDLDLASSRLRTRGTPSQDKDIAPGEQIRALIYAPEPTRAAWIERELSHPPITIQIGRRIRTVVAALVRDPPPRPDVLIVDFDAISPAELLELHTIRQGWYGRLIALGSVSPEICASLGVDHVFPEPLVRDSLLDCVAGTNHAVVTTLCPVIPQSDDKF